MDLYTWVRIAINARFFERLLAKEFAIRGGNEAVALNPL